ncbi:MAG: adenylyl cyclase class-3/4/guanylyl cyclase [Frankiales bacterium]|nr:adenylyl cyclase class-3/4/guanylyl cyclase [Frankiales bacterium]
MAFCTSCGHALVGAPADAVPNLPGPEEERRVVSVLAVDLVGFSATAQSMDPEDLQSTQRSFFDLVTTAVQHAGGTVAKRIGDAVVAVFGAPTAHENDPYRAVRAGLDVQAALEGRRLPDGRPLAARVGIATGEALVTFERGRTQPLVAGDVLNRAMGMQACAPAGGVLVARETHRPTSSAVDYQAHRPVVPAGGSVPVDTWVAAGIKARPDQVGDAIPLVGREPELGLLVSGLRRAMHERRGQLITLIGEPGLGKSRLTRALAEHVDSPATPTLVRWRVGACLPYGEGVSYWALGQVVKAQAQLLESDGGALARQKLEGSVDSLLGRTAGAEEVAQVKERLAALLGLPGTTTDVADDVAASHAAWRRYLLALGEDAPTVLVLEDLHWADDGFLDFLRSLVESAASVPLLILATARPELLERRAAWVSGLADAMTITLTPLAEPDISTVLARLLGDTVLPQQLQRRLLDLVNGNPLYAEEYVRMLTDSGALTAASQDLLADLPLPDSVQGVVNSRLDLLTAAQRSVVSAAAVVGEVFWEGAVAAVADADRGQVLTCLEALVQREVVRRAPHSTVGGEQEFAFRHVLVRDAAYSRIPRSIRVVQHRRCAEWLDALSPERGDDVAELRAHHRTTAYELAAVLGADLEPYAHPARQALMTAAERALRLHAVSAAHGFARRAVMLWYGQEDEPPALKATLLLAELAFLDDPHAFYGDGGPARVQETAEKLLALGDRRGAASAQVLLGQAEWYRGGGAELAGQHLGRAVDLLAEEPASEQSAGALAELGRLRMLSHQYGDAVALSDRAMAIARPLGLLEVEANALVTAGTARYSIGDPLGVVQLEEALSLSRQHGLRARQRAANNLAATMQEEGRLRRSYELIEESASATRGWGLSLTTRADDPELALRAWYHGQWDRLLEHADAFLATASAEAQQWESHLLALCGIVRALRGEQVPPELDAVVERSRRSGFPALVRSALAHLACCRFLQGRTEEAAQLYDELAVHTSQHMRGSAREWLFPAVVLAASLGGERLETLEDRLAALEPKTPWMDAAHHCARSFLSAAEGKHLDAVEHATEAVALYQRIGDVSTTAFARGRLAHAAQQAGDMQLCEEQSRIVRDFAGRNGATVLRAAAVSSLGAERGERR